MKKKNLILTVVATFLFSTAMLAQVPNYVPSNGLVGWWPFNGNANDESGNGNNGTTNGAAIPIPDRFNIPYSAISTLFSNSYVRTQSVITNINNSFTISLWASPSQPDIIKTQGVIGNEGYGTMSVIHPSHGINWGTQALNAGVGINVGNNQIQITEHTDSYISSPLVYSGNFSGWHNIILVYNNHIPTLYLDGVLVATGLQSSIQNVWPSSGYCTFYPQSGFGTSFNPNGTPVGQYIGEFDDIGIWNRALTQLEITNLFTGTNVGVNEIIATNLFSLYPNPASSQINVKADLSLLGAKYEIYDNLARVILSGNLSDINSQIELGNLSDGIYVFRLGDSKEQSFKIVKQ